MRRFAAAVNFLYQKPGESGRFAGRGAPVHKSVTSTLLPHVDVRAPQRVAGWINWSNAEGVITCEVLSPRKPANEWQLMHAFLGRLAARFATSIGAINIQFPGPVQTGRGKTVKRRKR
jgi:hypothetical protein